MRYLFSNLEQEGSKLRDALKTPFNLFVDLKDCKKMAPRDGLSRGKPLVANAKLSSFAKLFVEPGGSHHTIHTKKNRLKARSFCMAPRDGFEPPTDRLTVDCSTAELPGNTIRSVLIHRTKRKCNPPLRNVGILG